MGQLYFDFFIRATVNLIRGTCQKEGEGYQGMDDYLVRQLQGGDKSALEKLIRQHYDKIYSYCYFHVKDMQAAQDLTQETFCSVVAHIGEYMHYGKFLNYLYAVAGNKCKDYYRKKKPLYTEDLPEEAERSTDEGDVAEKLFLRELVAGLPKELEEVIILRFYEDLKYKDIAKILGVGSSLVKYRVKKALQMLRDEMERS